MRFYLAFDAPPLLPSRLDIVKRNGMAELTTSWRPLPERSMAPVIEFTVCGVHDWSHGAKIMQYIEAVLTRESAAALIINFDAYRYEFGNDLFGVLVAAGHDKAAGRLRPVCVVAHGQTEVALKSLLSASNTADIFDITFTNTPAQLDEWLHHKALSPT